VRFAGQDERHPGVGGLDAADDDEVVVGGALAEHVPDLHGPEA
jgi:hypothetical protein